MKCAYCGANLQIEDEKCPHCGRDNPHYIKHRSDMQAYQADYRNTKQEVLENELETYILLSKASELDKSVKKNEITMSEIVEEVKKARNEN